MGDGHQTTTTFLNISTQFENIGDAWLYRELLQLLNARSNLILNLSRCPPEFIANLDLPRNAPSAIIASSSTELFRRMLSRRLQGQRVYYFLSPGGYHGEVDRKAWFIGWLRNLLLAIFTLMGVRICLTGVSYERIGPRHANLLSARSRLLQVHLVRDSNSLAYAAELGIQAQGIMPDLSFGSASSVGLVARAASQSGIALSFRTDQYETQLTDIVTFLRKLVVMVENTRPWKIVVQVERDSKHAEVIAATIQDVVEEVQIQYVHDSFERARDAYLDVSYVIGNRLHSLLLGASASAVPIPAVDYNFNEKISNVFSDLRLSHYVHALSDPDTPTEIAAIINQNKGVDVAHQVSNYSKQLIEQFDNIFELDSAFSNDAQSTYESASKK